MRFALALSVLLVVSCTRIEGAPCTEEFWAKRPSWAEEYWTLTHLSDDTTCSTVSDCPRSLHYCVDGRCRAWCDGTQRDFGIAPECPAGEFCAVEVAGTSYPHGSEICRGMQGPDVYYSWSDVELDSRLMLGGVCVPTTTK